MKKTCKWLAILAASGFLVACGGGGGDSAPAVTGTAEGAYQGTTSNGREFQAIVLDDDAFWAIYGNTVGGNFLVSGFLQGQGSSSNGEFTSTSIKDFGVTPPLEGSLTGSYVSGTSLSGTINSTAGNVTFSGSPIPTAQYNYSASANLSDIVGSWTLTSLNASTVSMTIASSGSFSGSSNGCTFTGNIAPRTSGKNVFDFSLTFGAAPCLLPNQTASGIAITSQPDGSSTRQLLIAGVDSTRNNGTALFGTR